MAVEILEPTTFPLDENDPLAPYHRLIHSYLLRIPEGAFLYGPVGALEGKGMGLWYQEAAVDILKLPADDQLNCIRACARFSHWTRFEWGWSTDKPETKVQSAYEAALFGLCRSILNYERKWSEEEIKEIVEISLPYRFQKVEPFSAIIEGCLEGHKVPDSLRKSVELVREWNARVDLLPRWLSLGALLDDNAVLHRGEKWADDAIAFIEGQTENVQNQWRDFLLHCVDSEKGKPNSKWLVKSQSFVDKIGVGTFEKCFCTWCVDYGQANFSHEINQAIFKGLVWSALLLSSKEAAKSLSLIALAASRPAKSGNGAFSLHLFNACLWSLGQMKGDAALDEILSLKDQVRGSRLKSLEKAELEIAART